MSHVRWAKLGAFIAGAVLVVAATPGVGGLDDITSWWASPIAFEKVVIWALLWELLGFGSGSPTRSFVPVGALERVRPGTVRLPPWPGKVLGTDGTRRGPLDVALYLAAVAVGVALLCSGGSDGALSGTWVWVLLLCLGAVGVRDRSSFLAARPERYGVLLIVFVFPPENLAFGLKLVLAVMCWAVAASTVNRHFPAFVVAALAGAPWARRPRVARWAGALPGAQVATACTAVAFVLPLVLLVARGGAVSVAAVTLTVLALLAVTCTVASASWEGAAFFCYAAVVLFGKEAAAGPGSLSSPVVALVLIGLLVGLAALGSLRPELVSSPVSLRHLSGNPATSVWVFRDEDAARTFDTAVAAAAPAPVRAAATEPVRASARALLSRTDGRCPNDRRAGGVVRDGETIAAAVLGWCSGDGHLHGQQLLEAVQDRCGYSPGRLRVVTLEAQPAWRDVQSYRVLDAADGLVEAGTVRTADLLAADGGEVPVRVTFEIPPPPAPRVVRRPSPRPVLMIPEAATPVPVRPRPRPMAPAEAR